MQQHFFDVFNLEQNRNGCRSSANICNIFRNSCLGFQHLTDFWSLGWSYDVSKIVDEKGHHSALNFSQFIGKFTQGGVNQQRLLGILWPRNPDGLKLGTVGNVVLPRRLGWGLPWLKPMRSDNFILHSQHKVPIWHFVNWGFTLQKSDDFLKKDGISELATSSCKHVLEKVYSKNWRIFFIKTYRNGTWWNLHPGTLGMHGLLPKVYSAQWRLVGFPLLKPIDYLPTVSGFFGNPQGIHEIKTFWT